MILLEACNRVNFVIAVIKGDFVYSDDEINSKCVIFIGNYMFDSTDHSLVCCCFLHNGLFTLEISHN